MGVIKDLKFVQSIYKFTDTELAEQLDISRMTLNRWYKDESKADKEKIYSFIFKMMVPINDLKFEFYNDFVKENEEILVHGAREDIFFPIDLAHSKYNNDLGPGFYLGERVFQAGSFVCDYDASSIYLFKLKNKDKLKIYKLKSTLEWLLIVAYYRRKISYNSLIKNTLSEIEKADIVISPIADNRMMSIINEFIDGSFSDLQTIKMLESTPLGMQYCLRTQKALNNLQLITQLYLCKEEKNEYNQKSKYYSNKNSLIARDIRNENRRQGKYWDELIRDGLVKFY